jgi:hypothetical protein
MTKAEAKDRMDYYLEQFTRHLNSLSSSALRITKLIENNDDKQFRFSAEFLNALDTSTRLVEEMNRRMGR